MTSLIPILEDALNQVDAALFSGDYFYDPGALERLEYFIGRWQRRSVEINADLKTAMMKMPPKKRTITPPADAWKAHNCYLVNIAYGPNNPIHKAIFYSGFLEDGHPAGYNCLFNPTNQRPTSINDLHYLAVVRDLDINLSMT